MVGVLIRVISVSIVNKSSVVALSIVLVILYFWFSSIISTAQSVFDKSQQGVFNTSKH